MKLSRHFDDNEKNVACNCGCGFREVSPHLVAIWELLRVKFGVPVNFNSVCRCKHHNSNVGGASGSTHLPNINGECEGSDIVIPGVEADYVADFLEKTFPNSLGIGRYRGRTHVDVKRGRARRWDYR